MFIAAIFWLFMLATYSLVLMYGDRDARLFVHAILASALLTLVASFYLERSVITIAVLVIDMAVLALSLWIVARSDSYWPIWYAGFLSIEVCTAAAQQLFPNQLPGISRIFDGFWVLPAQLAMVIAIVRDHRAGLHSGPS